MSSCTRHGRRLIAVTMNDGNDWKDHQNLMESGFNDYSVQQLVRTGECLGSVPVISGEANCVKLLATEDFSYALSPFDRPKIVLPETEFVYAPVVRGQPAGFAHICLGEKAVGKVPLVYGETVEMEAIEELSLWEKLLRGGKS